MAQQVMQQMFQPPVNGGGVDAGGNPQQQQQPPPFMFPFGFPPPGQQGQGLGSHGPGGVGPAPFNINQMMQMILGGGGPGGGGGAGFPMGGLGGGQGAPPVIAGDFVFGDLQQVINRLMQMDQGQAFISVHMFVVCVFDVINVIFAPSVIVSVPIFEFDFLIQSVRRPTSHNRVFGRARRPESRRRPEGAPNAGVRRLSGRFRASGHGDHAALHTLLPPRLCPTLARATLHLPNLSV